MERNHYEFFSYNAKTSNEKMICKCWCSEEGMKALAMGIVLGLHQFRANLRGCVYLCKEDGTKESVYYVC